MKITRAQKTQFILKFSILLLLISVGSSLSGQKPAELCGKAEAASFTADKIRYTIPLGKSRTPEAKRCLLKMLNEGDMWGREAAAAGLAYFSDREVTRALIKTCINDIHTSTAAAKALGRNPAYHYQEIIAAYESSLSEKGWHHEKRRRGLLEIFAVPAYPAGETYLKKTVADISSPDRRTAAALVGKYYRSNYKYMLGYIDDPVIRPGVLEYLADQGSAADLPRFLEPIEKRESPENILIAYKGIGRFGKADLIQRVYLAALHEKDESLVQGAILTFEGIVSEKIRVRLCCAAAGAEYQRTRMLAGMALTGYSDRRVIPFLIPLLNEQFISKERGGVDMFLAGLTLGLTSIMDDLSESSKRSGFKEIRGKIHGHLKKVSGVQLENSYQAWLNWAVFEGYTVEGKNIIQYLFSPDRDLRQKAAAGAVKYLGAATLDSFAAKRGLDRKDERAMLMALAGELVNKGILDEGLPPCSEIEDQRE